VTLVKDGEASTSALLLHAQHRVVTSFEISDQEQRAGCAASGGLSCVFRLTVTSCNNSDLCLHIHSNTHSLGATTLARMGGGGRRCPAPRRCWVWATSSHSSSAGTLRLVVVIALVSGAVYLGSSPSSNSNDGARQRRQRPVPQTDEVSSAAAMTTTTTAPNPHLPATCLLDSDGSVPTDEVSCPCCHYGTTTTTAPHHPRACHMFALAQLSCSVVLLCPRVLI